MLRYPIVYTPTQTSFDQLMYYHVVGVLLICLMFLTITEIKFDLVTDGVTLRVEVSSIYWPRRRELRLNLVPCQLH
jgi:hypothetical protein